MFGVLNVIGAEELTTNDPVIATLPATFNDPVMPYEPVS